MDLTKRFSEWMVVGIAVAICLLWGTAVMGAGEDAPRRWLCHRMEFESPHNPPDEITLFRWDRKGKLHTFKGEVKGFSFPLSQTKAADVMEHGHPAEGDNVDSGELMWRWDRGSPFSYGVWLDTESLEANWWLFFEGKSERGGRYECEPPDLLASPGLGGAS